MCSPRSSSIKMESPDGLVWLSTIRRRRNISSESTRGIHNHWDNAAVNEYTPDVKRPIPFERMTFVGDGYTDIPTMKMLTYKGGHSIAVYDPDADDGDLDTIGALISADRVNFVAPADYTENSQLDLIVKGILGRIRIQQEETLAIVGTGA